MKNVNIENNAEMPITPTWFTQNGEKSHQPLKEGQKTGHEYLSTGLTKREYFAGLAMQAFASNPDWAKTMNTPDDWDEYKERLASGAVELADAVLSALHEK
jgi:hypothetical protein